MNDLHCQLCLTRATTGLSQIRTDGWGGEGGGGGYLPPGDLENEAS